jgi:hypothetical protein
LRLRAAERGGLLSHAGVRRGVGRRDGHRGVRRCCAAIATAAASEEEHRRDE